MKIFNRFAAVALVGAVLGGVVAAAPASAHTDFAIGVNVGPHWGYGPRPWYGPRPYYGYGPVVYQPVCWTNWHWSPYWQQQVPTRICR